MTTIAYRAGVLAADSRAYGGPYRPSPGQKCKIWRLKSGDRLGVSSAVPGTGERLREWFEDPSRCSPAELPKDFRLLLVKANGEVYLGDDSVHLSGPIETEYCAIGSGDVYAMGAMFMGASAVEAVQAACTFDPHTGGEIRTLTESA